MHAKNFSEEGQMLFSFCPHPLPHLLSLPRDFSTFVSYLISHDLCNWYDFYASAQRKYSVGILFFVLFVRPCVRPCVRPLTLLTISCRALDTFYQTYINDALWDRDERVTVWGQKVKGWGHGGIKHTVLGRALSGLVNTMSWKVLVEFSRNLHQWCIMRQKWMC